MVRYIIKLTKGENIKFISHLDYLKAVQRIIKRSGIKVQYSKGFNPHMECSFAQPLSVGVYSQGEYLDLYLQEEADKNLILKNLNRCSDKNIEFLDAKLIINPKVKKVMAMLEACLYTIELKANDSFNCTKELKDLISKKDWITSKKTKTSEIMVNLKEGIIEMNYKLENEYLKIVAMLRSGSELNLSSQMLSKFLKENMTSLSGDSFPKLERIEMYFNHDNSYIPIELL